MNLDRKARNYFILARIAEKTRMNSESAANYFKALTAINDFMLEKIGLKAKDHSERFFLLKQKFPELYTISDKMFLVYRRTYTGEINEKEVKLLRENVENAFKNAGIKIPSDEELKEQIKRVSKE